MTSVLDDVPGIGPHRKRALLKHFGTFQNIRHASIEDLAKVSGITPLIAQKIKEFTG